MVQSYKITELLYKFEESIMITYLSAVCSSALSIIFIVFLIGAIGYLVGAISVKGISLGTAGVLLIALCYGVLIQYFPNFNIGEKQIVLWSDKIKANFSIVSNIGTALFVTAVGLIAGPKFFRTFNRSSIAYLVMGIVVIGLGALTAIICVKLDDNLSANMAAGLLTGTKL